MSRRPILCRRARGDREPRNGGGRHHAYSGGDKTPPYSNADERRWQMAVAVETCWDRWFFDACLCD